MISYYSSIVIYLVRYRFRDSTTFTVYVTACCLEKSFSFDTTVEFTGNVRFSVRVTQV